MLHPVSAVLAWDSVPLLVPFPGLLSSISLGLDLVLCQRCLGGIEAAPEKICTRFFCKCNNRAYKEAVGFGAASPSSLSRSLGGVCSPPRIVSPSLRAPRGGHQAGETMICPGGGIRSRWANSSAAVALC